MAIEISYHQFIFLMDAQRRWHNLMNPRARRWTGTWNNYPGDWEEAFRQPEIAQNIRYLVVGMEVAPTTGTPHLHFYLHFRERMYKSSLTRLLPQVWVEESKGTELDNYRYVTKVQKVLEIGSPTNQTSTVISREENLKRMLEDLMNLDWVDFEKKYPVQAFHEYQKLQQYKINHLPPQQIWGGELSQKNFWVWGRPATGKSKWARSRTQQSRVYPKNTNKWWDGYNPTSHHVVVMEDFPSDGKVFSQLMKVWSDRYSFIGEVKGGQLSINPGKFFLIVTSNYSIETVFPGEDGEAIRRRFKEIEINDQNDLNLQMELDFTILA